MDSHDLDQQGWQDGAVPRMEKREVEMGCFISGAAFPFSRIVYSATSIWPDDSTHGSYWSTRDPHYLIWEKARAGG